MSEYKKYKKDKQRVMKHFRNKQKCGRKPYFLARSKILLKTITSHNLEKDIKRGKFALILFFLSFSSLYTFFLYSFGSFWWLFWLFPLVNVSFFIKLTQQGDDCVFKDIYAISFYDAPHVTWTDNGRLIHHSTGGFQAAKGRGMGTRLESLQGG